MKFAVFALIAGLCLVAVNAKDTGSFSTDSVEVEDFEYIAQDLAEEIAEIEPYGIFTTMYFVMKAALRTLKGVNCTIKEVLVIRMAALNFLKDIEACGGEVSKKVQTLIDACKDIITTCTEILGINESVCGNSNDVENDNSDGIVSNVKTAHKCFVKLFRKMQTLKKQIKRAVKMIKQIKKVHAETGECVMNAVTTLESAFIQFPPHIKECSKLAKNK